MHWRHGQPRHTYEYVNGLPQKLAANSLLLFIHAILFSVVHHPLLANMGVVSRRLQKHKT